jgi:hypothetical protein
MVLQKNRHEDQQNRIENPDMNSCNYTHLIFNKDTKNIRWRKDSLVSRCCWYKLLSACRKLKVEPCLSLYNSINSKWIKDLNVTPKTLKLVQERTGYTLEEIYTSKDFLSTTQAAQQLRERMDKWDYRKLKSFCTTKEMVFKLKGPPREWEKIFSGYTSKD